MGEVLADGTRCPVVEEDLDRLAVLGEHHGPDPTLLGQRQNDLADGETLIAQIHLGEEGGVEIDLDYSSHGVTGAALQPEG